MDWKQHLFKPKWQNKDADIRLESVSTEQHPELISSLLEIARTDEDKRVRCAAIKRLHQLENILKLHAIETDSEVKVLLEEQDLTVPTLTGIYHSADWPEREAAEMFGFTFEGHPNPKRLLLCDLFDRVHPLRKDYPLKGKGERDNFKLVSQDTT